MAQVRAQSEHEQAMGIHHILCHTAIFFNAKVNLFTPYTMTNNSLHSYQILKLDSNNILFSSDYKNFPDFGAASLICFHQFLLLLTLLRSAVVWGTLGKTEQSQRKAHPISLLSSPPVILSRKVIHPPFQGYLLKTQLLAFTEQYILFYYCPS